MKKSISASLLLFSILITSAGCSLFQKSKAPDEKKQLFIITEVSEDETYGYSKKNAVKVGGVDKNQGPLNERRYLNALTGPNGELVWYSRSGSCCPVESNSEHTLTGMALLDVYRVTWEGREDTVNLYINMYDYGEMKAPKGFGIITE